ncbi:hypothetical protein HYDPIDRAFT_110878 [Hydnomerulius pinastri MD-312]|nr:hypothetical protein HYDPIDRAFT_110878 [Hydnomerulius pinastri MD-312]
MAPLRLYDCENHALKDRETYLRETNDVVPPYLVVSQVWGEIKELLSLPTVPWPVPISNKAKIDTILGCCQKQNIRWLWMDILCINQASNSMEAEAEKDAEIPKMREYYRGAFACLVVPQNVSQFCETYKQVMDLFDTVVATGAPVRENAKRIWECISQVDALISDQWFWRVWTFQELLLPKKLVLLDGQELRVGHLGRVADWYYKILRNGSLTRPAGGTKYDFVDPGGEVVLKKNWDTRKLGWDLKEDVEKNGHVNILILAAETRDRSCKFPVDRLLGLYGLLNDEERVPIEPTTTLQRITQIDDTTALETVWARIMCRVITSGRVWPLLNNVMNMNPDEAQGHQQWMPQITAFHRRQDAIFTYPETFNHRNRGTIQVTEDGLHIPVRVIGRVIASSTSLGDGGGSHNMLMMYTWFLKAKGLDADPISQQLKDGLAASDAVLPEYVEETQRAFDKALNAPSLPECLGIYEDANLRIKFCSAPGVTGWDKTILVVHVEGRTVPVICLAWTHRSLPASPESCWILDVTTDPVKSVPRWVVANMVKPCTFRKIGTVRSYSPLVEDDSVRTMDVVFS